MKWSDLPLPWQICFEESLEAYCAGTVPVGALVLDGDGKVLGRARNRIWEQAAPAGQVFDHQLAHAELNVILTLRGRPADLHTCSLYTSMEPCPLCMGAIYMSGIRKIYFAAKDPYAGSVNLLGSTPYLSRKPVQAFASQIDDLNDLITALNTDFVLRGFYAHVPDFIEVWRGVLPRGVDFGEYLFQQNWFETINSSVLPAPQVFETLLAELKQLN